MRNEPLNAYSLHQRAFQEKRSIYYLFTKEYGVLHGVAKKGVPQFVALSLFATGKKALKTLQQVQISNNVPDLKGQQQYAGLYINEITLNLLPVEESLPNIYDAYAHTVLQLQSLQTLTQLKLILRHYERDMFTELGYEITLYTDNCEQPIKSQSFYRYEADKGWQIIDNLNTEKLRDGLESTVINSNIQLDDQIEKLAINSPNSILLGEDIIAMRQGITAETLFSWSLINKQLIDYLFDYKPLHSRRLWQQFTHYQNI